MELILTSVQILFYVTTGIVVVLTYLNARKSLLNPVHTEYQKHVIERLGEVSKELASEFDPDSPNFWLRDGYRIKHDIEQINNWFREHKEAILKEGKWETSGCQLSVEGERAYRLARSMESDPFIPPKIRKSIVDFLDRRFEVVHEAEFNALQYYQRCLARGENIDNSDDNLGRVHNRVNRELYRRGFGIAQVEKNVNVIRQEIQAYLESFNPTR